jgi:hypothetical protein
MSKYFDVLHVSAASDGIEVTRSKETGLILLFQSDERVVISEQADALAIIDALTAWVSASADDDYWRSKHVAQ